MRMRFQKEVWGYFIRFVDEKRVVEYKKQKGRDNVLAFYDMPDDKFYRMLNTLCWIQKFQSYTTRFSFDINLEKPTNEDILEVMNHIEEDATGLLAYAKQYVDKEMRNSLRKKARRELDCVAYYRQLINEDYFKDKELRDWTPIDIENEEPLEIPK
ncbi:hypothetical protein CVD28_03420 [Bacillus sp. M6-12]|uniref:hypothetical protein n=1 Tax=Bacillus sp. M6-12 TaxID=2054166 RepID=UPI000C79149C|nr:hypothetical protein [Bacillus sp. M6-12]PLS19479.1 hypothetical protein CVD28_03420 [Bacillus sp. M6-12]